LFSSGGLDSGTVTADFVGTYRPRDGHSVVLGVNVGLDKDPFPGEEFDLGASFGPRAYPLHSFTGDRMFFTSAEYRVIAVPSLWNLFAVGFAAFADYGGAWYAGETRRSGTDLGVGLRLGSIRGSSGGKATRIDLARRFANDALDASWVIVVGAGFTLDRPQKVARQ
jgi:hemolysin activation/secretion protein